MLGVAASCLDQMFRLNRDLKIFTKHFEEGFIEHYKGWLGNSDLEIEYEKWDQQKEDNIKKISQFMGLKSDSHLIIETLEYYKTNTMLDANTLMLPNHISKNSDKDIKDRLSKTEYDHFYTLFKKHNIEV